MRIRLLWLAVGLSLLARASEAKRVALTFDDGPQPFFVEAALPILEQYNARATFFYIGRSMARWPHLAPQVAAAGHEIENHSYSHSSLTHLTPAQVRREILATNALIVHQTGQAPRYFRPPYAFFSGQTRRAIQSTGMEMALWTVDPRDWATEDASLIVQRVLHRVRDGSVVLLHERPQTVRALPDLLKGLQKAGYKMVTLRELLENEPPPAQTEKPDEAEPREEPPLVRFLRILCGLKGQDEVEALEGAGYELLQGQRWQGALAGALGRWQDPWEVRFRLWLSIPSHGWLRLLLDPIGVGPRRQEVLINSNYVGRFQGQKWVVWPYENRAGEQEFLVQLLALGGNQAGVAKVLLEGWPWPHQGAQKGPNPPASLP